MRLRSEDGEIYLEPPTIVLAAAAVSTTFSYSLVASEGVMSPIRAEMPGCAKEMMASAAGGLPGSVSEARAMISAAAAACIISLCSAVGSRLSYRPPEPYW